MKNIIVLFVAICLGLVSQHADCRPDSRNSVDTCSVQVMQAAPEVVDLGLSVKWSSCNLGATESDEHGLYFAWGDVAGQRWNGVKWARGFNAKPMCELDADNTLNLEYDPAHVLLGGNWRMPTMAEFKELIDNCAVVWTSSFNNTGASGIILTGKKAGYLDQSIFLPAAGCGIDNDVYKNGGSKGCYWTSSFQSDSDAHILFFGSDGARFDCRGRELGLSIRPVME